MKRSFLGITLFAFFLIPTTSKAGTDVFLSFHLDVPSPVFVTPPTVAVPRGVQPAPVSIRSSGPEIKHKVKRKIKDGKIEYEEEFEDGKHKIKYKTKPEEIEFEEEFE